MSRTFSLLYLPWLAWHNPTIQWRTDENSARIRDVLYNCERGLLPFTQQKEAPCTLPPLQNINPAFRTDQIPFSVTYRKFRTTELWPFLRVALLNRILKLDSIFFCSCQGGNFCSEELLSQSGSGGHWQAENTFSWREGAKVLAPYQISLLRDSQARVRAGPLEL